MPMLRLLRSHYIKQFLLFELLISFLCAFDCFTNRAFSIPPKRCSVCFGTASKVDMDVLAVAKLAARKAGRLILEGSGRVDLLNGVESKIGTKDIVTEVDRNCQDVIKETILEKFPNHNFLGEEDIPPGITASKQAIQRYKDLPNLWIVDPIDGTTNFAHGLPLSGVIIAFASGGEVLLSAIYDPFRDEMFEAIKGHGAFLNGERIKTCATGSLSAAVVSTGSPPNTLAMEACLRGTIILSPEVK